MFSHHNRLITESFSYMAKLNNDEQLFVFSQDLFIGGHVQFCRHPFILIDADEYAINYMESHAEEFPRANPQAVANKLRRILADNASEVKLMLDSADRKRTGNMGFEEFK